MTMWLNPGVVPPPTLAGPIKRDWYALMGAHVHVWVRVWGITSPLELEES